MKLKHIERLKYMLHLANCGDRMLALLLIATAELIVTDLEFDMSELEHLKKTLTTPKEKFVKTSKKKKKPRETAETYDNYLKSKHWKEKRDECFKEKGKGCQKCYSKLYLHVHHGTYQRFRNENVTTDLFVLCNKCHEEYHSFFSSKETTIQTTIDFILGKI